MIETIPFIPTEWLQRLTLPAPNSHKGQNGKLLIIGGSELFHAASKWSLDIASKFVDMVFYASTPSNNQLVKTAKGEFWNGIVIESDQIPTYIQEADVILIGPGMLRETATATLTNQLLSQWPTKKWVIDAGALQMVDPTLLTASMIVTPHLQELAGLAKTSEVPHQLTSTWLEQQKLTTLPATILCKGPADFILHQNKLWTVTGGNAGMTKGGTGDVLAGLVAALYTQHDALTACLLGSYSNKKAGEALFSKVGPFFNASDLVATIPEELWQLVQSAQSLAPEVTHA
jgi:hydroxyethylthiazole kinase-like uncharacterized protein yjeF